jgi:hypothetical protein
MVDIDVVALARRKAVLTSASLALTEKRTRNAQARQAQAARRVLRERTRGAAIPGLEEEDASQPQLHRSASPTDCPGR